MPANAFQSENAALRTAGDNFVADDNRPNPRHDGCNGHAGMVESTRSMLNTKLPEGMLADGGRGYIGLDSFYTDHSVIGGAPWTSDQP
jgi:hypothetical protein